MARWFLLRGRLRELDTLERVQDAWNGWQMPGAEFYRVDRHQTGEGSLVVQPVQTVWLLGLASLSCLVLSWEAAARRPAFLPAPSALRRVCKAGWQRRAAIRGRWRRAQDKESVARRRFAGCESAGSGRPASGALARRSRWLAPSPSCRMIRIMAWAHGCSASF